MLFRSFLILLLFVGCASTIQAPRTPEERAIYCANLEEQAKWARKYTATDDDMRGMAEMQIAEYAEIGQCVPPH